MLLHQHDYRIRPTTQSAGLGTGNTLIRPTSRRAGIGRYGKMARSAFGNQLFFDYKTWLAVVLLLSALASFIPARNASRLTVREVLAYE